jgi:ABC-type hemin transport system ATPase subunit
MVYQATCAMDPNVQQKGAGSSRLLALICAEHTDQAGRFQSSNAPRVLLAPRRAMRGALMPAISRLRFWMMSPVFPDERGGIKFHSSM